MRTARREKIRYLKKMKKTNQTREIGYYTNKIVKEKTEEMRKSLNEVEMQTK